jgi:hypothetical protein
MPAQPSWWSSIIPELVSKRDLMPSKLQAAQSAVHGLCCSSIMARIINILMPPCCFDTPWFTTVL